MPSLADAPPVDDPAVLIVDDDPDILGLVQDVLQEEGLAAETAADGREALARLRQRRPAVLVLDLLLPDLGGDEVAAAARITYGAVPIVLISGAGRAQQAASALGVLAYLSKPFDVDALVRAVRRGLAAPPPSPEVDAVVRAAARVVAALRRVGVHLVELPRLPELPGGAERG